MTKRSCSYSHDDEQQVYWASPWASGTCQCGWYYGNVASTSKERRDDDDSRLSSAIDCADVDASSRRYDPNLSR